MRLDCRPFQLLQMPKKKSILVLTTLIPAHLSKLEELHAVTYAPNDAARKAAIASRGREFEAVLTIGVIGLTALEMASMPRLELVCCMGAGYEQMDVAAAKLLGIEVATGQGTNDACVADHAFGLVIAAMRGFRQLDRLCRNGVWRTDIPHPPNVSGKSIGILGLGTIGQKIANRAAGFDMLIGYHNRNPKPQTHFQYFGSVVELAQWSDVLVCATPGGTATRHLISEKVLSALGPTGFLVNIARGSVVDTNALAAALRDGVIAGAGIDVYESEPLPPQVLMDLDNVIVTPHMAGWSPEVTQASFDRFLENVEGYFSGNGAVSPL